MGGSGLGFYCTSDMGWGFTTLVERMFVLDLIYLNLFPQGRGKNR